VSKLLTGDEAASGLPLAPSASFAFGTPAYMCPSYMRTHKYDARSEAFSFGVVLCELLTGRLQLRESAPGAGDATDLVESAAEAEGGLAARRDARLRPWAPLPGVAAEHAGADVVGELEAWAARCVARRPDARPPLSDVAAALAALRARHCAPAAEAAALAGQLGAVEAARDALLAQAAAADAAAAAARGAPQACNICHDKAIPLSEGIACAAGHFVCTGCITAGVQARGDMPAPRLQCFGIGCAEAHSDRDLILRLPVDAGVLYLSQLQRMERALIETEAYAKAEQRVAARAAEDPLASARRRVIEQILTLACPSCSLAMPDYGEPRPDEPRTLPWDGCFAVQCAGAGGGCGAYFCGWCWRPFPGGAHGNTACHAHVRECALNTAPGGDLFGGRHGVARFTVALRARRQRQLAELLATLSQDMRAPLLQSLARELADAGLDAHGAARADADTAIGEEPEVVAEEEDDEMEVWEEAPLLDQAQVVLVHVMHTAIVGVQHHVGGARARCTFRR
jgi:hypothetical protein